LARCLIIGCGCRGRALGRELQARGHAVRGTTRDPAATAQIEAAGAEAVVADPDRVASLAGVLDHVSVACLLLGSARGDRARLAALHGSRLEMLLARMLDTTVRGVVYEATGTVEDQLLRTGAQIVAAACEDSRIPYALLTAQPTGYESWIAAAVGCVELVLAA
jgi:uncharacterized protein YbjT (DUF2867 family)